MLTAARDHYREQQKLTALAVRAGRRASTSLQVAAAIAFYQAEAIGLALTALIAELQEQGVSTERIADVVAGSLVTDRRAVAGIVETAPGRAGVDRLVSTLVQDAGRTASAVGIASRPAVTAHVRMLNLPSCGRCAVLAGRVYRWSSGFQRHPKCDCVMVPTTLAAGTELTLDGRKAALAGQIRGLSKADMEAIEMGADLGRVVNVRSRKAGLTVGSSVVVRGGKPTPQAIIGAASTRDEAVLLLKRHGYIAG